MVTTSASSESRIATCRNRTELRPLDRRPAIQRRQVAEMPEPGTAPGHAGFQAAASTWSASLAQRATAPADLLFGCQPAGASTFPGRPGIRLASDRGGSRTHNDPVRSRALIQSSFAVSRVAGGSRTSSSSLCRRWLLRGVDDVGSEPAYRSLRASATAREFPRDRERDVSGRSGSLSSKRRRDLRAMLGLARLVVGGNKTPARRRRRSNAGRRERGASARRARRSWSRGRGRT